MRGSESCVPFPNQSGCRVRPKNSELTISELESKRGLIRSNGLLDGVRGRPRTLRFYEREGIRRSPVATASPWRRSDRSLATSLAILRCRTSEDLACSMAARRLAASSNVSNPPIMPMRAIAPSAACRQTSGTSQPTTACPRTGVWWEDHDSIAAPFLLYQVARMN
jgi:hypothetical protein